MPNDPAIDAVRTARVQISEEFGDDPIRLVAHYIAMQRRFAERLIRGPEAASEPAAQLLAAPDEALRER